MESEMDHELMITKFHLCWW